MTTYTKEQVYEQTLDYFNGDELAAEVFFKYCLQDSNEGYGELTPDDMHHRLAKEFARADNKFPNPISEDVIYKSFKGFKQIVPQGSPMFGVGNNNQVVSLSSCVVIASPLDNMESIFDTAKDLAQLFKRRCGVGLDLSNLRPAEAKVNNSAKTSTGAWSFADFYSYVTRMIGQSGRRGALMQTMDIRHPDIYKFINMKRDLTKVTGANVSVKITDDFMKAVVNDNDWELRWPCEAHEPTYTNMVKARHLWMEIITAATETAEPGLIFWDNSCKYLPAHMYEEFKSVCVNPCSELILSAYDSCRLISINLKNFVTNAFEPGAKFDFVQFDECVRLATRLSDDLVELELEKLQTIIKTVTEYDEISLWQKLRHACSRGRRIGLGTHGLADVFARLGLAYDSNEALQVADEIDNMLKISAYDTSVDLAIDRGPFPAFDWNTEKDNAFIQSLPTELQNRIKKHGRRNISLLTNAPTGSVSIESQTSSGLEPVFRNQYTRRRKLSPDEDATPDFVDDMGDRWKEYTVFHHNVKEYFEKFNLDYAAENLPSFFVTSDQIDWRQRIKLLAVAQRHRDHSISNTINLPKGTSPEVVAELYMDAWKHGLKGVTVYVDGSRDGVLITDKETEKFVPQTPIKRTEFLPCGIHHTSVRGAKWVVLVGLMNGYPYEVFAGKEDKIELPRKYDFGKIRKVRVGRGGKGKRYDLQFDDDGVIKDIVGTFDNANNALITRFLSMSLRQGADIPFVIQQLQKDSDADMFSFNRIIARVLKKYVKDGTRARSGALIERCPHNGDGCDLMFQEGCVICATCGASECG